MIKKGLILSALAIGLTACSQSESDKVADAQACLDSSTPATAQACMSKIEGVSSKEASLLRCSAGFITEGLASASTLSNAFSAIGSGGGNPTLTMMGVLAFDSFGTDSTSNQAFADETFNHCNDAGNPGFVLVASFSRMATTLAVAGSLFDGTEITADELQTAVASLSTAENSVIGSTAVAAYTVSCSGENPSNPTLCTELETAITAAGGPSNTEAIGAALSGAW
jgi:hypothetical protein